MDCIHVFFVQEKTPWWIPHIEFLVRKRKYKIYQLDIGPGGGNSADNSGKLWDSWQCLLFCCLIITGKNQNSHPSFILYLCH